MFAEIPAASDAEEIKQGITLVLNKLDAMNERLDRLVEGFNSLGANQQWMVDNVKGIFTMFSNPAFMSQMTNTLMGSLNGGQPESEPVDGPSAGAVA